MKCFFSARAKAETNSVCVEVKLLAVSKSQTAVTMDVVMDSPKLVVATISHLPQLFFAITIELWEVWQ